MNSQYIESLIDKFLKGKATPSEQETLTEWYRLENQREVVWPNANETSPEVEQRMLDKINLHVYQHRPFIPFNRNTWFQLAAILVLVLALATFLALEGTFSNKQYLAETIANADNPNQDNKYVILPDSSKIVLHSNSKISYKFSSEKRKVILTGEAYFDVHHEGNRPFVIQTGRVRTTVLGTAFNINAYPGNPVTVSVARGKVSVEDEGSKTSAILISGQELSDVMNSKQLPIHTVNIAEVTKWINRDMKFSDTPFATLARQLEHRYDVKIEFANTNLEHCLINGGFTGMETLEEVLTNLTQTVGAHYKINHKIVVIDGQGCEN